MELKIRLESWKMDTDKDTGQKKIAGTYAVVNGKTVVATKSFNDSYGSIKITFPASILAEIEKIDEQIKAEVINFFEGA